MLFVFVVQTLTYLKFYHILSNMPIKIGGRKIKNYLLMLQKSLHKITLYATLWLQRAHTSYYIIKCNKVM